MATVRFRGTRADVTRLALQLAAVLAGRAPDTHGVARGFGLTLGFAALSDIKNAFVIKVGGGTDEMGIRWPPLAPATIAARRVGPGDKRVRAGQFSKRATESQITSAVQKAELIKRRERIRKRETKKALQRFRLSLPEGEAQRRAKIVGGLKATRETAQTKVQTLGGRQVQILRDTGVLLNSLGPGRLTGQGTSISYSNPSGEGGEEHIFEVGAGEIIVGTNVKYASTHQHGDASRNIPARPFLPDENHAVPSAWWDRWLRAANQALMVGAEILYRDAA